MRPRALCVGRWSPCARGQAYPARPALGRGYIVPRDHAAPQKLVAGSTLENAGYEKAVTPVGSNKSSAP